jgi:menaquinone-specific isochorismate synthase
VGTNPDEPGHRLAVRTDPASPAGLIASLPVAEATAWVRGGDGLVGWGEAARIVLPAGEDRFAAAQKRLRELFGNAAVDDRVRLPGTGPVAFGSFTFDPASEGSVLVVPRVILGRRAGRGWRTTITVPGEREPGEIVPSPPRPVPAVRWHDGSLSAPAWERATARAIEAIRAGQLRKVVLALDLHARAAATIDPRVMLARLAARYPGCYTFCCAGLAGATPELLIRRQGQRLSALVLAGTAPRGGSPAEDDALGAALLASAKNREEHGYAVADVRAVLATRCAWLDIDAKPSLLRFANVAHLGTSVRGRLAAGRDGECSALELAGALHPTAAVCGTPAAAAMELIRELEGMDRGRYAGPVGWVDSGGNGEWGIALRCAEIDGVSARLFAGCGIVAGSDPATELAEAQAKFRPVLQALEG